MMVKIFRLLRKSSLMVKVSKFSVKSEEAIACVLYNEKAVLKSFKNVTEKNLCMSFFSNKVAGLQPETFFEKGICTRVFQQVLPNILEHFSAKHVRVTPAKYSFVCHVNLSRKMLPCFYRFTLNIFRTNISFL